LQIQTGNGSPVVRGKKNHNECDEVCEEKHLLNKVNGVPDHVPIRDQQSKNSPPFKTPKHVPHAHHGSPSIQSGATILKNQFQKLKLSIDKPRNVKPSISKFTSEFNQNF